MRSIHELRSSRGKRREGVEEDLDLTSMIDVVFLLLVFFLCATQFRTPEGILDTWLPRDRGTASTARPVDPGCRLTLSREGNEIVALRDFVRVPVRGAGSGDAPGGDPLVIAQVQYEEHFGVLGPDLAQLRREIAARREAYLGAGPEGLPVMIDAADDVPALYTVALVNLCEELGIRRISFSAGPGEE